MIFVTVGAQMAFDRLTKAVDEWCGMQQGPDVFAQIGPSDFCPQHMKFARFLDSWAYREKVQQSNVLVAHAGIGSILTALEAGKPILVLPRRGHLRETRNDHQMATAHKFLEQGRIHVAFNDDELKEKLDYLSQLTAFNRISSIASDELLGALRAFIDKGVRC